MKTLAALFLLLPSIAIADCSDYGLYAFALYGCPEQRLGVEVSVPLCQQDKWKHLAYYDYRCYEPVPLDYSRADWTAPTPYERLYREPISGKVRTFGGSYQEADWNYRACRQTLGEMKKGKKR